MKIGKILMLVAIVLTFSCFAFADRQLERAEILQILKGLTDQPKDTWISAGTIKATHEEYRAPRTTNSLQIDSQISQKIAEYKNNAERPEKDADMQRLALEAIPFNVRYELANEYTMTTTEIVKYDGERFYWEINLDSRTDSVKPDQSLAGNYMTDDFNPEWNARRIFVWDGENYTTYVLPVNNATVDSTAAGGSVNGPLTAGLTKWGYGYYSYDNLAALDSFAEEKYIDGQTQIHLTLNDQRGRQNVFVLDPAKDNAVVSCAITGYGNSVILKQYSDYQLAGSRWVPQTIILQKFALDSGNLLLQDTWNLTSIDANVAGIECFAIDFEPDALIEYKSAVSPKTEIYRKWNSVDTDQLLSERLTFEANQGTQPQNCATAALKYITAKLGKNISDTQLAELVNPADNQTSLLSIRQKAESLGLYCKAVICDIDTLKNMQDCQIILHIPGKKHFVAVAGIDAQYIRLIDLTSRKFFYRTDLNFFGMDWPDGTALLISNNPIAGSFTEIDSAGQARITGAAYYDCNYIKQQYNVVFCSEIIPGDCDGFYYRQYNERWGCGEAQSGSCSESTMERYRKDLCIEDPYIPSACNNPGNWTFYYMQACL